MNEHLIQLSPGTALRLPTAGKYCDRDILVQALAAAGLPAGVEALACGSFSTTGNTEGFELEHGLPRKPNFFLVLAQAEASGLGSGFLLGQLYLEKRNNATGESWMLVDLLGGGSPSAQVTGEYSDRYGTPRVYDDALLFLSDKGLFRYGVPYWWMAGYAPGLA